MDAKPHRSKLHRLSEIIYFSRQLGHILRKNGVNPSLSSFLDIILRLGFSFETPQQTPSWTYIRSLLRIHATVLAESKRLRMIIAHIGKEEEEEEKERVETTSRNTPSTHKYFNAQFPL